MISGDFNVVRFQDEKNGGLKSNNNKLINFNEFIEGSGLLDLKTVGPGWTSSNKQEGSRIFCELDRLLGMMHGAPCTQILTWILKPRLSDHTQLCVEKVGFSRATRAPPLNHFSYWCSLPSYLETVQKVRSAKFQGTPRYLVVC